MGISINTNELYEILDITPESENIMLSGKHGIGKSQILTAYFEKKGMKVVPLFLGQMSDPGDLIGLPVRDASSNRTVFMPPYWFPENNQPVVLFLDELNRARPEVLQTIMDLALNKTLAGRKLPEGSRIIAAVNDGEDYQITDLDPALVSRFNIYEFHPGTSEWLNWADGKIDKRIITFISKNPDMLDSGKSSDNESSLEKSADRRGWEKVSLMISGIKELSSVHQKAVAGIIGYKAAARFFESISDCKILDAVDILLEFADHKAELEEYDTQKLALVNDSIFRYLERNESLFTNKTTAGIIAENLDKYSNLLFDNNRKEAIAHFTSCMEGGLYNKGTKFVVMYAPKSFARYTDFVMNI